MVWSQIFKLFRSFEAGLLAVLRDKTKHRESGFMHHISGTNLLKILLQLSILLTQYWTVAVMFVQVSFLFLSLSLFFFFKFLTGVFLSRFILVLLLSFVLMPLRSAPWIALLLKCAINFALPWLPYCHFLFPEKVKFHLKLGYLRI